MVSSLAIPRPHINKKTVAVAAVSFISLTVLALLFPHTAHAMPWDDWLNDVGNNLTQWVKDSFLVPSIENMLSMAAGMLQNITTDNLLTGNFKSLFATGSQADAVWGIINKVHQSLVVPVGHSLLAAAVLVQLVKISQKVDATATLPAVKEIVILVVFFVVFTYMINHGPQICEGIYNVFNDIAKNISGDQEIKDAVTLGDTSTVDIGFLVAMLLVSVLVLLSTLFTAVIAYVVAAARAIQLYVMAVFSPIPIALLGFEETRSMGINFFKNFAAVCLAGSILVLLIAIFPVIYTAFVGSGGNLVNGDGIITGFLVKSIGIPVLFMIAMVKSGSWARDILGG